jgi:hypothetical protein
MGTLEFDFTQGELNVLLLRAAWEQNNRGERVQEINCDASFLMGRGFISGDQPACLVGGGRDICLVSRIMGGMSCIMYGTYRM